MDLFARWCVVPLVMAPQGDISTMLRPKADEDSARAATAMGLYGGSICGIIVLAEGALVDDAFRDACEMVRRDFGGGERLGQVWKRVG